MAERGVFGEFFLKPVRMGAKSEEAGRDIFEDHEYVRIFIAGDSKTVVEKKADAEDKARFSGSYEAWKRSGVLAVEGTPLEQWTVMSPAKVRELASLNIRTVEHLSGLSDAGKQRLGMGANELVAKATAFLEAAKDSAAVQRYAADNVRLQSELANSQEEIKRLAARMQALEQQQTTPRKDQAA